MKLLRQVKLHFQEGKSDKVYEVDLVETAPGKHVVNFRYGRRGGNLRDGTKTVMPVDRATADGIFDTLVASKTSKGYRVTSEEVQAPVLEVRGDAPEPDPANDTRAQAILARLRSGGGDWPLHRVAWRAGDAGVTAAVPLICAVPQGTLQDLFSYVWALGRLVPRLPADDPAVPAAVAMLDSARAPGKHEPRRWAAVARIATDGLIAAGDVHDPALAARERATIAARIPVELHPLLDGGDPDVNGTEGVAAAESALALRCREAAEGGPGGKQRAEAFRELCLDLYLHRSLRARDAVIRLLPEVRLHGRVNQGLFRSLWKLAELRRDGRLFGAVVRRYERARAYTGDWIQPSHRKYFRRRAWRTLRKLGGLASGDYVELAAGICLAMSDDDGVYPWGMAHHALAPEEAWDKYTRYWAFAQIVMGEDARFTPDRKSLILRNPEPAPATGQAGRVERFPALWDRAPGHLLKLCIESRCGVVHAFAARALSFATEFLDRLVTADIAALLGAPYAPTSTLGLDCAVRRFDPGAPDWELAVAAANSPLQRARRQGWDWCGAGWDAVLADSAVLAALLTSPRSDTLQWCDTQLESGSAARCAV
jgi:predicted DNA-binding WGR domain protein